MVSGQKISRILLRFFVWKVDNLFESHYVILLSIPSLTVGWKAHSSGIVLVWSWCCTGMTSKLVHHSEGISGLVEAILDSLSHIIMCDNAAKVHVGELLGGWTVFSVHFDWCGMLYIQHHDFCLLLADLQAY